MDVGRFVHPTGKLVPIEVPKKDIAFVPSDLPADWTFDSSLWPLLVEAKEALGTLNGIGQTLDDPNLLLRPLQSREALASSKIEGTYVTPQQLLLYELDPREPSTNNERMADWKEVFNYNQALQRGCELLQTLPLCNRLIKEVHQVLMQGVRGLNKGPGKFRTWQVQIGSSARFMPPPPNRVAELMTNLERYLNDQTDGLDPLVRAFLVHYQFEAIHPFGDGNGRVGRLLLALMVYQLLGHSKPWLYLSAFFDAYRDEYVENLFNISASGSWTKWVEFCLQGTVVQAKDSIARCHGFNRLRKEYSKKVDSPSPRTRDILDDLFSAPIVTATSVASKYNVTYPTARSDLEKLVAAGILKEIPEHRPKSYVAVDIMRVAYSEQTPTDETVSSDGARKPPQSFEESSPAAPA